MMEGLPNRPITLREAKAIHEQDAGTEQVMPLFALHANRDPYQSVIGLYIALDAEEHLLGYSTDTGWRVVASDHQPKGTDDGSDAVSLDNLREWVQNEYEPGTVSTLLDGDSFVNWIDGNASAWPVPTKIMNAPIGTVTGHLECDLCGKEFPRGETHQVVLSCGCPRHSPNKQWRVDLVTCPGCHDGDIGQETLKVEELAVEATVQMYENASPELISGSVSEYSSPDDGVV